MRVVTRTTPQPIVGRPTQPPWRMIKAYLVTFVVLASYLWIRFQSRFRAAGSIQARIERANLKNARRIYRAILELQGLYIKVGQLFSIMTNFLPDAFRAELEGLQDQVPPRAYSAIERCVRDEFEGRGPKEIFETFAEQPVASASIGQVHLATLKSGHRVAVKVQYPDIDRIVRSDLRALRRIISIIQRFISYQGLDAVYREIRSIIIQELDFTREAEHLERISANFEGRSDVAFPRVLRELSTRRVLTTEFVDGVKANDLRGLEALKVDRRALARLVIETYCQQIFHHGIYHADPHPGNILARPDGGIAFLDFGATAVLSSEMKAGITDFLEGVIGRNTDQITRALRRMGFIARTGDTEVSARVIEYFHRRFQEEIQIDSLNLKDIKIDPQKGIENIADFRKLDISIRELTTSFRVPKDWVLLERTVLLLTGLCTHLDPEMNPMTIIRPYLEEFVFGKNRDFGALVLSGLKDTALRALSMPDDIQKFLTKTMRGELEVRFKGMREGATLLYALGHQIIYTMMGLAALGAAWLFDERGAAAARDGALTASGVFGVLLLGSMWAARRWRKR
jgi:predicted unusual protein kinase regulating ubiquinone biosynthesis (AarF/ABC1/UbiB family)